MSRRIVSRWLRVVLRIAFPGCLALLAALSWLPAQVMTRTTLGGSLEHVVAYLGTAIVMALAYPGRPRLAVQAALLIAVAAVLETGQLLAAGRNASLLDFAAGAAGVAIGGFFMWFARRRIVACLELE